MRESSFKKFKVPELPLSKIGSKSARQKTNDLDITKQRIVAPPPIIKDGHVHFTTMRQELLAKPEHQSSRNHSKRDAPVVVTECTWEEPFVLYYCEACLQWDDAKSAMNCDESPLKFAIQMGYDELVTKKREVSLNEHLVGEQESF